MVDFSFNDLLTVHPTELNLPCKSPQSVRKLLLLVKYQVLICKNWIFLAKHKSSFISSAIRIFWQLMSNFVPKSFYFAFIFSLPLLFVLLFPGYGEVEFNKKKSCSIQLTNKTERIVAYRFSRSSELLVPPKMGTILPRSKCSATVTMELRMVPQYGRSWIYIWACVVEDGVDAEDITRKNLYTKISYECDYFMLPVLYTPANSSSPVHEKNQNGSLLDNLLHQSLNEDVNGTTSECEGTKSSIKRQLFNDNSSIINFSEYDIQGAINNLSDSLIGKGGYGTVYKGNIHNTEVAIKVLDSNSEQGIKEFLQEMEVLGQIKHPNLVKLIGGCLPLQALVYEFLLRGSLEDCLQKNPRLLTWKIRTRIVYDICSALIFLHSVKPQAVVHGDLKPANILLDANYISKLADFGLCRFLPKGTASVVFLVTKPKGTFRYIDPEFLINGILTTNCDVYSFGITIFRLLTGTDANGTYKKVRIAYKRNSLMEMVDPTAGRWPTDVSEFLAYFGLKCCARKRSSGLLEEIALDLKEILAEIGE